MPAGKRYKTSGLHSDDLLWCHPATSCIFVKKKAPRRMKGLEYMERVYAGFVWVLNIGLSITAIMDAKLLSVLNAVSMSDLTILTE